MHNNSHINSQIYPQFVYPVTYGAVQPQNPQEERQRLVPQQNQIPQQYVNLQQQPQYQQHVYTSENQNVSHPIQIQPRIESQRALKFETPVVTSQTPMGATDAKSGILTFHSSNLAFKLVFLFLIVYMTIFIVNMSIFAGMKRFTPLAFFTLAFLIPIFLLALIFIFSRKYAVEFDDLNRKIVIKSSSILFCGLCKCDQVVSYNDVENIGVEFFRGYKSSLVLTTVHNDKITLLQGKFSGSGYHIWQNQAAAQEMRAHLVKITSV